MQELGQAQELSREMDRPQGAAHGGNSEPRIHTAASIASNIATNRARGKAAERALQEYLKGLYPHAEVRGLTRHIPGLGRRYYDASINVAGRWYHFEVKTGPYARYNRMQRLKDNYVQHMLQDEDVIFIHFNPHG